MKLEKFHFESGVTWSYDTERQEWSVTAAASDLFKPLVLRQPVEHRQHVPANFFEKLCRRLGLALLKVGDE